MIFSNALARRQRDWRHPTMMYDQNGRIAEDRAFFKQETSR